MSIRIALKLVKIKHRTKGIFQVKQQYKIRNRREDRINARNSYRYLTYRFSSLFFYKDFYLLDKETENTSRGVAGRERSRFPAEQGAQCRT